MFNLKPTRWIIFVFSFLSLMLGGIVACVATTDTAPKNPCSIQNPCNATANPCAAKNPCGSSSKIITRPAGTKLMAGNQAELLADGKKMWADTSLSTNGMACQTCHKQGKAAFGTSFAEPYPHTVGMVKGKFGIEQVELDEMVQFCILEPMAGKALPWDSKELAALTAYTSKLQQEFK